MKRNIFKLSAATLIPALAMGLMMASCNKDLPEPTPNTFPVPSTSIAKYIASDTNFRLFRLAVTKVGMLANLDSNKSYTVYAPSNTAFRAIGFDSAQIVNASGATLTSLGGIVGFHIIPGEVWKSTAIPEVYPNVQLPTTISLGFLPGTPVPFPMTAFLSKRGSNFWYNNVPGLPTTVDFTYGSLNQISKVSIPPTLMVKNIVDADPTLSLFDSLLVKADSGQTTSALIPVLLNPGANITLFAPTNTAVKAFIAFITGGLVPAAAPDAVHAAFIRTNVLQSQAQGIAVYHVLAVKPSATSPSYVPQRAFSVNFSTTPTFYKTLVNGASALHPGVSITSFFTGQSVDSMKVQGAGLAGFGAGPVATSKPATAFDKMAVNGVVHVVDQVLRP